jgi:formylglycine-generating enzyme required for sulfatase activity
LDVGGKLRVYWGLIDRVDFQDRSSNTADGSGAGDTSSPVEGRSFRGMVWIPAGQFTMGSPLEEAGRDLDEGPQTVVTLTRGFWIGAREITQAEYTAVMRSNPSAFAGNPQFPVEKVTWRDAKDYCERLTQLQEKAGALPPGYAYRLPTEAEWEYACRAGSHTRFSYGEDPEVRRLPDYAWYGDNCDSSPHPVGLKQPNPWGLYDMHGNVLEWCLDAATSSLPGGTVTNHQAPEDSSLRIARGGSWLYGPKSCRAANRDSYGEFTRCSDLGFRVVLAPVQR